MDLVSLLPWWAGVGLSLLFYVLLHQVAAQSVTPAAHPGWMGAMMVHTMWKTLALYGQYLLPIICLAGAGVSAWRRRQRKKLVADVTQNAAGNALDGMSWREFEMLVGEGFRLQGYQVVETGGGGADGGVDLVLSKPGKNGSEKYLVQCKQWRAYKVGVDVVRQLYGVMAARGAAGGYVVTSGRFTDEAVIFGSGRNVTLIDGPKLLALLPKAKAKSVPMPTQATASSASVPASTLASAPSCPVCSKPMARRKAKRGANAGADFWGCTGYPTCRGTRPI